MEIIWSPQSLKDIEEIGTYIAKDSPEQARAFVDKLISTVEQIKKHPHSGQIVIESPAYRHVVFQKYRIIYRLTENALQIITILAPGLEIIKRLSKKSQ